MGQASVPAYASFSRSQYLRILHLSMSQYMRMYFHVSVHAYVFNFHASVHAYEFSRSQYLRTLILVFVCCKTRLVTFVLRGCDSISLVPYVPGPILATICRGANSARNRL